MLDMIGFNQLVWDFFVFAFGLTLYQAVGKRDKRDFLTDQKVKRKSCDSK